MSQQLMEKVVKPATKELNKLDKSFISFKCEPLYVKRRGKPLTGYKFTWQAGQAQKTAPTDTQATATIPFCLRRGRLLGNSQFHLWY